MSSVPLVRALKEGAALRPAPRRKMGDYCFSGHPDGKGVEL